MVAKKIFLIAAISIACAVFVSCTAVEKPEDEHDPVIRAKKTTKYMRDGINLINRKKHEEALEKFKMAVRWRPDNFMANSWTAWTLYRVALNLNSKSKLPLERSKGRDKVDDLWVSVNYTDAQKKEFREEYEEIERKVKGYLEEANSYAHDALICRPGNVDTYNLIGQLNTRLGNITAAIEAFREVLNDSTVNKKAKKEIQDLIKALEKFERERKERDEDFELPDEFKDLKPPE